MARRTICWVAAMVLCAAAVAFTVAVSRMAHSPWCDGPTLLPSVLCSLHPTRWVSKGYYPINLFKSRKGRAGAAPPTSGLTTDVDAATDFGETAGGSAPQPKQPADVSATPATAKLDAVVEHMEAGGSHDGAGSGAAQDAGKHQGADGGGRQPDAPAEQRQRQEQQSAQDLAEQQRQQQQAGAPVSEQPHKTSVGPAEQQRAQLPPDAQAAASGKEKQDGPAEQQPPDAQAAAGGQEQQDAPPEQLPPHQPQQPPHQPQQQAEAQQHSDEGAAQSQQAQQQQPAEQAAKQGQQEQKAPTDGPGTGRLPPVREVSF